jgi:hypothetical protein
MDNAWNIGNDSSVDHEDVPNHVPKHVSDYNNNDLFDGYAGYRLGDAVAGLADLGDLKDLVDYGGDTPAGSFDDEESSLFKGMFGSFGGPKKFKSLGDFDGNFDGNVSAQGRQSTNLIQN